MYDGVLMGGDADWGYCVMCISIDIGKGWGVFGLGELGC